MGEAKKRGTFEERRAATQKKYDEAKRSVTKWEVAVLAFDAAYGALIVWMFPK